MSTDDNPGDIASRPQNLSSLSESCWFRGPAFLWLDKEPDTPVDLSPVPLPEEEPSSVVLKSSPTVLFFSDMCLRSASLKNLLGKLKVIFGFLYNCYVRACLSKGAHLARRPPLSYQMCIQSAIKLSQKESLHSLLDHLSSPNSSKSFSDSILQLAPFLDSAGLIRVGGRLGNSHLPYDVKHPYLISSHHPFATLLVSHFHLATKHQGRHITLGAVREAGFFLTHGSSFVKKYLRGCMTCRKLRGAPQLQKMSDLPVDRLEESPPFTYSGMDVFGPYLISESRSTRRYNSDWKVWGLVFTCLVSRAIHIEPLPSMDTSTFKNAIRRFFD